MFSIKPSRVPQSLGTPRKRGTSFNRENAHQKPRQNFQPYGVPVVDDRRRLPSYARDAASEVISMYESASQKSASRVFDEPDYRSCSMTQTSYSSYTLSNHRSYNSLRSQAETNPQVQRPRSPFAYPARLKRPGFRASSPALRVRARSPGQLHWSGIRRQHNTKKKHCNTYNVLEVVLTIYLLNDII